jgi:hypothetical protein
MKISFSSLFYEFNVKFTKIIIEEKIIHKLEQRNKDNNKKTEEEQKPKFLIRPRNLKLWRSKCIAEKARIILTIKFTLDYKRFLNGFHIEETVCLF